MKIDDFDPIKVVCCVGGALLVLGTFLMFAGQNRNQKWASKHIEQYEFTKEYDHSAACFDLRMAVSYYKDDLDTENYRKWRRVEIAECRK